MLMLFQLVITIMVLLILVRIFYLSVFLYLPRKRLAEQYESLSQVIMSFTQMLCYNVYVPLLLRMSNDVEENPGPTIYGVVDPSKTICADSKAISESLNKMLVNNVWPCL